MKREDAYTAQDVLYQPYAGGPVERGTIKSCGLNGAFVRYNPWRSEAKLTSYEDMYPAEPGPMHRKSACHEKSMIVHLPHNWADSTDEEMGHPEGSWWCPGVKEFLVVTWEDDLT